ncbi:MAG: hypothetical protein WCB46_01880, partial [Methanoregula sp.]
KCFLVLIVPPSAGNPDVLLADSLNTLFMGLIFQVMVTVFLTQRKRGCPYNPLIGVIRLLEKLVKNGERERLFRICGC